MTRHGASLQRLSLAGCGAWVTDDELQLVTQHCSDSLVCLDLCGCAQLSDFWVSDCLRECKSLTTVSLAMMGQLSAEALAHWAAEEPMQQQQQQDDPALQELAVPLPCALQRLDLTGCGGIGWFGLQTALRGGCGEGLLELSLRGQVAMPADGIVGVLRCCPNLLQLDASCCLSIDDSTVSEISSLCPQLRTLAISACPAVAMPLTTGKPHRTSHTCTPVTLRLRDSTSDLNTADVATAPLNNTAVLVAVLLLHTQSRQSAPPASSLRHSRSPAASKSARTMACPLCSRRSRSWNASTSPTARSSTRCVNLQPYFIVQ
jgi:hypothetical protein